MCGVQSAITEGRDKIIETIKNLPEIERKVLILTFYERFTPREIVYVLGLKDTIQYHEIIESAKKDLFDAVRDD